MLVVQVLDDVLGCGVVCLVLVISGLQGSGKLMLVVQVVVLVEVCGLCVVMFFIDDVYLIWVQCQCLVWQVYLLLLICGLFGIYDLFLVYVMFDVVVIGGLVILFCFDKLVDECELVLVWLCLVGLLDLLVFEGWFFGMLFEIGVVLVVLFNVFECEVDLDGCWWCWCNEVLVRDYLVLWQCCNWLWFLQLLDFLVVLCWCWQQEQNLQVVQFGCSSMSCVQLEWFVQYYEWVSWQVLCMLLVLVDWVIMLDEQCCVVLVVFFSLLGMLFVG